jgi:hypothetical protein
MILLCIVASQSQPNNANFGACEYIFSMHSPYGVRIGNYCSFFNERASNQVFFFSFSPLHLLTLARLHGMSNGDKKT